MKSTLKCIPVEKMRELFDQARKNGQCIVNGRQDVLYKEYVFKTPRGYESFGVGTTLITYSVGRTMPDKETRAVIYSMK